MIDRPIGMKIRKPEVAMKAFHERESVRKGQGNVRDVGKARQSERESERERNN